LQKNAFDIRILKIFDLLLAEFRLKILFISLQNKRATMNSKVKRIKNTADIGINPQKVLGSSFLSGFLVGVGFNIEGATIWHLQINLISLYT
jgi:hypothetical protein